jgi:serine/threonine protein kinase
MDWLPGESLRRRLRREYSLDCSTALWIGRQVAEALSALHRAGFLHADVKPDNIRLTDAGAVLIDLGFAHRPGENAQMRQHGYVLGTASYLAPELCAGDDNGDFRSDLFSLGVTLFEMLVGRLPYPLGTVEETLLRHMKDEPLDIGVHLATVQPGVAALVNALLQRRPENRPRAAAVVQQLVSLEIATFQKRRAA